jgi:CRP/FNR family transcriptional regulator, cyclic AMP receptor protein
MGLMMTKRWAKTDVRPFLANGRWFGSLPDRMQEAIIAHGEIVRTKASSVVYGIGDTVDGLYVALDGDVRAYAYGDDGERIFLRALGPGSWFGDAQLLDDHSKRSFEVRSCVESTLFFLPAAKYRALTDSDIAFYRAFVRLMCIHVRHTMRVLVEGRSEAPQRAARALVRLARAHGIETDQGVRLGMNLSQADLASLVGVSRQYMNELIARWENDGFLRWNGKSQPLLVMSRLRTLLGPLDQWIEDSDDWV